jgi:predicted CoA-substrate-specific enzyme activase
MIVAGIDAGSRTTKAVLWDDDRQSVLASGLVDQGIEQRVLARALFERLLQEAGIGAGEVRTTVATGYGRNLVDFAKTTITEITCHGRGVSHWHPETRTIVEIGGQDSKLIRLQAPGVIRDFAMNDRCAAGTGRFLEMVSTRLDLSVTALGDLAQESRGPTPISSMCVVFAETEIIGLMADGRRPADIVAGVQQAVANRVAAMAGRVVEPPVRFTGGVALISGMAAALQAALGHPVAVAREPMLTGALGAALLAAKLP